MFNIFYKKNDNKDLFNFFTDNSKNRITEMQNYIPIYSRFFSLTESNDNKINLNNKYSIKKIKNQETENKFSILVENNDKNKTTISKQAFFKYLLPEINKQNEEIIQLRHDIKTGKINSFKLKDIYRYYRVKEDDIDALLKSLLT